MPRLKWKVRSVVGIAGSGWDSSERNGERSWVRIWQCHYLFRLLLWRMAWNDHDKDDDDDGEVEENPNGNAHETTKQSATAKEASKIQE